MKRSLALAAFVGCAILLFLPACARAEIVVAESIEWVLATSDRVVVGKVVKVDKITGSDDREYQAVTVAISKTLKGAHADRETFLLDHYIYKGYAGKWMDEGIPIAFCLIKNDGKRIPVPAEKVAWLSRENGNDSCAVLLGTGKHHFTGCIPVLTRDFEVLTEKEAILKFVEQTVKAAGKDRRQLSHTLDVPSDTAVYKELWSMSSVRLIVPIDEKLETLGRSWCKSDWPRERSEGAHILRHFKNDKNIVLLKSLLDDPHTAESTMGRTVPGKNELELVYRKKLYYVRQAAFDTLRQFGVKMDRPVLEVLLEGRDEPAPNPKDKKR